jgi:4-amino-4-deoxy-L-arabinose transferase-like glycosyltransferase
LLLAGWAVLASRGVVNNDAIEYMQASRDLRHYDSEFHPPLYPVAIAFLTYFARDEFLAAKLVSLMSGIALVVLTGRLGRRCLGSSEVGLLGAALVAVSPLVIVYSAMPMSDMMGAALFLLALVSVADIDGRAIRPAAMAGVACGLAYLTRYVCVAALVGAIAYVLVLPGLPLRRRVVLAGTLCSTFLVTVAPWFAINFARHGNLHNDNHVNVAVGMFECPNWNCFDDYKRRYPSVMSLVLAHPRDFVRHVAKNVFHFPQEVVLRCGLAGGFLALPGLILALHKPAVPRLALCFLGAPFFVLTMMTWYEERFFLPLLPVILSCGAFFCVRGLAPRLDVYWPGAGQALAARVPIRVTCIAATVMVSGVAALGEVRSAVAASNVDDELAAADFLRRNTPSSTRVLSINPRIAWYAERPYVSMIDPTASNEERLRATGADVFVFTGRHVKPFPQLEYLLHPEDERVPTSFRLIYQRAGAHPIAIYDIRAH